MRTLAFVFACVAATAVTLSTAPPAQAQSRCLPVWMPKTVSVPADGGLISVALRFDSQTCKWSVKESSNAATAMPKSGKGDGVVTIDIAANTSNQARTLMVYATTTVGGIAPGPSATLTINQARRTPPPPPPPPPCSFTVTPTTVDVPVAGGRYAVALAANRADCAWTGSASASSIGLSPASGIGSSTVTIQVPRNDTAAAYVFSVVFTWANGQATVLLRQPSGCRYTVTPSTAPVPFEGGTFALDVRANFVGCPQAPVTSSNWMIVTNRGDDTGTGQLTLLAQPNPLQRSRTGVVNIDSTRVQVSQAGAPPNGTTLDSGNIAGPVVRAGAAFRTWYGSVVSYGVATDVPLLIDADGDGLLDHGVYRQQPGTSIFYLRPSTGACPVLFDFEGFTGDGHLVCRRPYGTQAAIPLRFNIDGDSFDDVAVYDPTSATLFVTPSGGACSPTIPERQRGNDGRPICSVTFGLSGDRLALGDYDGDGRTDLAVWRPSSGYFHVLPSTGAGLQSQYQVQWGLPGDIPVPGRYIGMTRTSLAVYRPSEGNWYLASDVGTCPVGFENRGTQGQGLTTCVRQFGLGTDVVVPQDYDGDGLTDIGLMRSATSEWMMVPSSGTCSPTVPTTGLNTDGRPFCRVTFAVPGGTPLSGLK